MELPADPDTHWQAEYEFWHKIITEEVDRLRFNGGYEPLQVLLYPRQNILYPDFIGETLIGHKRFRVTARFTRKKTLVVRIFPELP